METAAILREASAVLVMVDTVEMVLTVQVSLVNSQYRWHFSRNVALARCLQILTSVWMMF